MGGLAIVEGGILLLVGQLDVSVASQGGLRADSSPAGKLLSLRGDSSLLLHVRIVVSFVVGHNWLFKFVCVAGSLVVLALVRGAENYTLLQDVSVDLEGFLGTFLGPELNVAEA